MHESLELKASQNYLIENAQTSEWHRTKWNYEVHIIHKLKWVQSEMSSQLVAMYNPSQDPGWESLRLTDFFRRTRTNGSCAPGKQGGVPRRRGLGKEGLLYLSGDRWSHSDVRCECERDGNVPQRPGRGRKTYTPSKGAVTTYAAAPHSPRTYHYATPKTHMRACAAVLVFLSHQWGGVVANPRESDANPVQPFPGNSTEKSFNLLISL